MDCTQIVNLLFHVDQCLVQTMNEIGPWLYVVLFAIVFSETGLVCFPFLPGDSLLFAAGSLCALPNSPLHVGWLIGLLITAAIMGDFLNYHIGYFVGPKIFSKEKSIFFNSKHLDRTQTFYHENGKKTIIIARFVPIVRTFAPFVAGIGKMPFRTFAIFSVSGGILWVTSLTLMGLYFGQLPIVQKYFHFVVVMIVVISTIPIAVEWYKHRKKSMASKVPL